MAFRESPSLESAIGIVASNVSQPDAAENRAPCPLDPYVVMHDKSTFIDQQMIKVQESHGLVPVGELPRHLLLCVDR
jgi:DNA replication licensing factor MCM5